MNLKRLPASMWKARFAVTAEVGTPDRINMMVHVSYKMSSVPPWLETSHTGMNDGLQHDCGLFK